MATKAGIFNLALGALLLRKQIINTDTDVSNEANVLNIHWSSAFEMTLEDMDLTSTSTQATLSLITLDPNTLWDYAYAYPTDCMFFRRIQSSLVADNRNNHIPKQVRMYNSQKAIFTNEENAIGEYVSNSIPLSSLSASAALAVAYRLAYLSAPLITGKGAKSLREEVLKNYVIAKSEAQEKDRLESFSFNADWIESEFVEARMS